MFHPRLRRLLVLGLAAGMACTHASIGEGASLPPLLSSKVYLQISPQGQDDLEALFRALEDSVAAGEPQAEPVIIVLHGPEALPFIRRHYVQNLQNRSLVDRAAKLMAFNRIELRMCETWMRKNGFDKDDLLPFVDTVPLAPAEVERLEKEGYVPYTPGLSGSRLL
jgi:hypothetical protein